MTIVKAFAFGIGTIIGALIVVEGFNIISGAICGKLTGDLK